VQVALQPGRSSSFEIVVGNGPKQTDPLQIYSKLASCVIPMIPSSFVYLVAMEFAVSSIAYHFNFCNIILRVPTVFSCLLPPCSWSLSRQFQDCPASDAGTCRARCQVKRRPRRF
jgi:hypothetical protein